MNNPPILRRGCLKCLGLNKVWGNCAKLLSGSLKISLFSRYPILSSFHLDPLHLYVTGSSWMILNVRNCSSCVPWSLVIAKLKNMILQGESGKKLLIGIQTTSKSTLYVPLLLFFFPRNFRGPCRHPSIFCSSATPDGEFNNSVCSSSWAWFFSLFFITKFHIELCYRRPTTYFAAPKKTAIFMIYLLPNKTLKYAL